MDKESDEAISRPVCSKKITRKAREALVSEVIGRREFEPDASRHLTVSQWARMYVIVSVPFQASLYVRPPFSIPISTFTELYSL